MDEIKNLLDQWGQEGLVNPDALEKASDAILLLVNKIEELEQRIANLEAN